MLRSPTSQSLLRGFTRVQNARLSYSATSSKFRPSATFQQLKDRRPQALRSIARPTTISLFYATKSPSTEDKIPNQKLKPDPKLVSLDSSVRHVFEGGENKQQNDGEMLAGVKSDWKTIKETFSLGDVPRESLYLGLAGLLPYAATSASTVLLSYDINHAHATGTGIFFTPETAHQLLDLVTPIQIGFGAVVGLSWI